MPYIYNDEDNVAMNDPIETLNNITGYISFEEMRAVESGKYSAHKNEMKDALMQKQDDALECLLDMLNLKGKCRSCPNIVELAESCMDKECQISEEQFQYLEHTCKVCGGQKTGVTPEKQQAWLDKEWDDRLEWAKNVLPRMSCAWCPTAFRIYGQYKDPDDEWKAIDNKTGCANCKIFQEGN